MQIIEYPNSGICLSGTAIALGFFDGVHIGHRKLIERTVSEAKSRGLKSAIFTFRTESSGLKSHAERLYPTEDKLEILGSFDVDHVILADFSALASQSPESFVNEHLVGRLGCSLALAGYNFRFGKGAAGDATTLTRLMSEAGGEALILPEERFEGGVLSTTEIRRALSVGDCERASAMLGSPYHVRAVVEHGLGIGHSFGFPTLNTRKENGIPLPRGVYATVVKIDGKLYTGVTNLGVCPTFEERAEHFETMLLGFDERIYGKTVYIYFVSYLRPERPFPSPTELKAQIDRDAARAVTLTENYLRR